jgi:hypothetical protein
MPFAVLDTYPEFLRYWRDARGAAVSRPAYPFSR